MFRPYISCMYCLQPGASTQQNNEAEEPARSNIQSREAPYINKH